MLGKSDLEQNLREIPRWSAESSVPDVNYFRDVVRYPHVFLENAAERLARPRADAVDFFLYPKGGGRLREFALLSLIDQVVGRTLAGEIAVRTDSLLPRSVFSYRLQQPPPRWRFRAPKAAHRELRAAAKALVARFGGMSRTDIKSYYPSIDVERLQRALLAYGCNPVIVDRMMTLARAWQAHGCRGIPIGGEAFAVLGNAYVLPLDVRLTAQQTPYLRWVDDIYWFGSVSADRLAGLEIIDQEFLFLNLERNTDKTEHFSDPALARAAIEDGMLTSLFESTRGRRGQWARERIQDRFLEHIVEPDEVDPRQYRGLLRTLQNRRDSFAVDYLIIDPELLNIDPAVAGDYLTDAPPTTVQGEAFIDLISRTSHEDRDLYDARDLHLLRALAARTWGRAEGQVFWDVAMDSSRRGPVRAWAVIAGARTPAWSLADVMERALEEEDSFVRRALVLSLYRARSSERVARLLRHIRNYVPDLIPPAEWVASGRRPPRLRRYD